MMQGNFGLVDQNSEARLADTLVGQGTNANLHWLAPILKNIAKRNILGFCKFLEWTH